ncbi:MAG: hypothetical protein WBD56_05205 [Anaerolineales bacterium]
MISGVSVYIIQPRLVSMVGHLGRWWILGTSQGNFGKYKPGGPRFRGFVRATHGGIPRGRTNTRWQMGQQQARSDWDLRRVGIWQS